MNTLCNFGYPKKLKHNNLIVKLKLEACITRNAKMCSGKLNLTFVLPLLAIFEKNQDLVKGQNLDC